MSKPLVLTCDIGTQSARALLVDPDGRIVDVVQSKYAEPYFSKEPGWAEQKPNFYFDRLCECCRELCARSNALLPDVIAMTITVIRDTVVCLDANNEPLRDIILWLDKRTVDPNGAMPAKNMMLFKVAGMEPTAKVVYAASVGNWIMRHEPEIWARTAKYVMLPTYLNYKLTGNLIDSASNQIGHIPFDYKNRRWMKPGSLTRCFCDVPNEKLCDLVPSGTVIGTVTDEVCALTGIPAGLPLISTGSDKGCETLGLAVVDSDKASISLGTTATIQFSTTEYVEPQQFLPAYPGVLNDHYNPEIEIYRGLWLLSWFVKEFGTADAIDAKEKGIAPEALLDERIRDLPAGSDGLLLQPYWTAGILHPDSLGAVIGFSDYHTRYHFYRAIIEGLCLELYMALRIMEDRSGLTIHEIRIGGGGAKSDVVCQIAADVFGLPVVRSQTHEACSIGSSMVAFVAKGVFADFDAAAKAMSTSRIRSSPTSAITRYITTFTSRPTARSTRACARSIRNSSKSRGGLHNEQQTVQRIRAEMAAHPRAGGQLPLHFPLGRPELLQISERVSVHAHERDVQNDGRRFQGVFRRHRL